MGKNKTNIWQTLRVCWEHGVGKQGTLAQCRLIWAMIADGPTLDRNKASVKTSPQTRDVDPMLVYSWLDVVDGGPTLGQHWFNVSCLLVCHVNAQQTHAFTQCWFNAGPLSLN